MTLASRSDVAAALGLSNEDALSASQQSRVDGLLDRVSGIVEREAQRSFTPGPVEAQMIVTDSRVFLQQVATVESVSDLSGGEIVGDLSGEWLTVARNGCHVPSGERLIVEYTRAAVPAGVKALTAGVVARHLTVEPVEAKTVESTAGPFRTKFADWVSDTALLTGDEIAEARTYRNPIPNTIIHRL